MLAASRKENNMVQFGRQLRRHGTLALTIGILVAAALLITGLVLALR